MILRELMPLLVYLVLHVVFVGAKKKVIGINAWRVIALVAN